jgi:2-methylcitrate dehydratase
LLEKTVCLEDKRYSLDYLDPDKRSIANAVQVFFKDGSQTKKIEVEYPLGHKRRRQEGIPLLQAKFKTHLAHRFPPLQSRIIFDLLNDQPSLENTPVNQFMDLFVI